MKTIVVTGGNGQLGSELRALSILYPEFNFLFTDVQELDICDAVAVNAFLTAHPVDAVVNCAAYTAVDKAEEDVELCYQINQHAVEVLGKATASRGVTLIHISTDYVFDGRSFIPYTEEMPVAPASVYGKSKLAGELSLMQINPAALILRTSWLYSSVGNNFVKTMLKLGRERDELKVVFDQVGTPTYAADLATAILKILQHEKPNAGLYHFSNEGVCSWYDFAISIHRLAGIHCHVLPVQSNEYPSKTPRPHYSVLNKAKLKSVFQMEISHWEDGLQRCLNILLAEQSINN